MVSIAPGTRADYDELVVLMGDTFAKDAGMRVLVGEHSDLRERMHALYGAAIAAPLGNGTVDVARKDGVILGAAIWHLPGALSDSFWHYLPQTGRYLRAFGFPGVLRALRIYSQAGTYRPRTPHWYLQGIGVNELARGRGIGSVLLDHRLARIDAQGQPAYLESSNKRTGKLYATRGFEVTRRIDAWPAHAPYGMWRPAKVTNPASACPAPR